MKKNTFAALLAAVVLLTLAPAVWAQGEPPTPPASGRSLRSNPSSSGRPAFATPKAEATVAPTAGEAKGETVPAASGADLGAILGEVTSNKATITINPPTGPGGVVEITAQVWGARGDKAATWPPQTLTPGEDLVLTNLVPQKGYTVQLSGKSSDGSVAGVATLNFRTPTAPPPATSQWWVKLLIGLAIAGLAVLAIWLLERRQMATPLTALD